MSVEKPRRGRRVPQGAVQVISVSLKLVEKAVVACAAAASHAGEYRESEIERLTAAGQKLCELAERVRVERSGVHAKRGRVDVPAGRDDVQVGHVDVPGQLVEAHGQHADVRDQRGGQPTKKEDRP